MDETNKNDAMLNRDATTLRVLGSFFALLGTLVLIGSLWAIGRPAAFVVNLCAGFVLVIIGAISWFVAARIAKR